MIFYYLNKKTNKWSQISLPEELIENVNGDYRYSNEIPYHVGTPVPVLDYVDGDEEGNESNLLMNANPGDTYNPVLIPIHVVELQSQIVNPANHNTTVQFLSGNQIPVEKPFTEEDFNQERLRLKAQKGENVIQHKFADKLERLTETNKSQKSQVSTNDTGYTRHLNNTGYWVAHVPTREGEKFVEGPAPEKKTRISYVNRDGLSVHIERKFGGGYIKTIGLGFDKDGNVENVLGIKKRNAFFKNSFGAKNDYNEHEREQIQLAKDLIKTKDPTRVPLPNQTNWTPANHKEPINVTTYVNAPDVRTNIIKPVTISMDRTILL